MGAGCSKGHKEIVVDPKKAEREEAPPPAPLSNSDQAPSLNMYNLAPVDGVPSTSTTRTPSTNERCSASTDRGLPPINTSTIASGKNNGRAGSYTGSPLLLGTAGSPTETIGSTHSNSIMKDDVMDVLTEERVRMWNGCFSSDGRVRLSIRRWREGVAEPGDENNNVCTSPVHEE